MAKKKKYIQPSAPWDGTNTTGGNTEIPPLVPDDVNPKGYVIPPQPKGGDDHSQVPYTTENPNNHSSQAAAEWETYQKDEMGMASSRKLKKSLQKPKKKKGKIDSSSGGGFPPGGGPPPPAAG